MFRFSQVKIKFVLLALFTVSLFLSTLAMATERRMALLIGVADYHNIQDLKNTVNDTRLLAKTLKQLDFDVNLIENPDLSEFRTQIEEFAFKAETADVALVYFAGHGIEFGGVNYLVPADIEAKSREEITKSSISLDEVLLAVDRSRQLKIVILDSCRNDPFFEADPESNQISVQDASVRRAGLAPASPDRGTLVAFAAEPGHVALDGSGNNSPFAIALSQHLNTPDLEIGLTFRRVRDSVLKSTNNQQEPHTNGSLPGKPFFLAGNNQSANQTKSIDRLQAWGKLAPDQEAMLENLAQEGDARALLGLAYIRLNPEEKKYDPQKAVELLEQAAKLDDPEAQYELGKLYERGIGIEQNTKRALELYNTASQAGYADAINDLGFLHFQGGLGVLRDQARALKYFEQAANLRHPEAMFNFAAMIDDGIVTGKKPVDAADYLYQSLRSGSEEVLNQLRENPRMFKKTTRLELQRLLAKYNHYSGGLDGLFGPQTFRGMNRAYGIE